MKKELNIQQYVFFKGNLYGVRKYELLNKIDVFLRPSRCEYMPSSILEAASASVPSIVSRETNMGEYITQYNAGYVLENNNENALAKLLLQGIKEMRNGTWDLKKRNAYRMVNEQFQWDKIAQQHIQVYEKVLNYSAA
jgi:glycosyltransferase involved in cell wall biosynthesis